VLSSQLAARKVSGSGSATILDVRCALLSCRTVAQRLLAAMRRVLHLKMVTQCAMLEDFGIFLVLADKVKALSCCELFETSFDFKKSLFAYHIEALVPTSPHSTLTQQTPQKLNGSKDVHFFSVGSLQGRTLVIYMKKKGVGSCSFALALESIPYPGV
jgi:hypothetical protein